MSLSDTIVAISTPPGESGIGIVRLSGSEALDIVGGIFKGRSKRKLDNARSHTVSYGHVVRNDEVIDEVLVTVMRAPRTYTREDIVEINCHGGIVPLRRVLELVLSKGARLAEPGEFTKRAFLNGRIDLAQAEAVLDIISSRTEKSCKVALAQLGGVISAQVEHISQKCGDILAQVEAEIDFPDDTISVPVGENRRENILSLVAELNRIISTADIGTALRDGLRVSIVGRPNVGKSSLFNAILGTPRTIVTCLPGTTRDVVEEMIDIEGIPVRIADTAGIVPNPGGIVEKEAVERSMRSLSQADTLLIVVDGSEPLAPEDERILEQAKGKSPIVVVNKCDLPLRVERAHLEGLTGEDGILSISATENIGIESVKRAIAGKVWKGEIDIGEQAIVTNVRHLQALKGAEEALRRAINSLGSSGQEVLAFDLRDCLSNLGTVVGKVTTEDILDRIFSEFCIGK